MDYVKKALIPVFAALLSITACTAQKNATIVATDGMNVRVTVYSSDIVRIEKYPLGTRPSDDDGMCVIMEPQKTKYTVKKSDGCTILSTENIKVSVNKADATVSLDRTDGTSIISETPSICCTPPSQTFRLENTEAIYGLGQHREGGLNLRGEKYHLINENMEIAIPLVHSAKGYAIFWNNGGISDFSDSLEEGMKFSSETGSEIDYFVICGDNADEVISGIRSLSGKAPMFPLWSTGFAQSKERYVSQDEILGVARWFRDNDVPLDCIVQDWQYWNEDNRHWNAVEFGNPKFPDPKKMLDDIHGMNLHCMISVWPSFGPDTDIYKEFEAAGHLMPHATYPQQANVRNYDPFSPEAREILWNRMRDNIYSLGMDAWWLDATEPEHSPVTEADLDFVTAAGPFRQVRNLYPLASVGGVYDAQKQFDPSRRVFILTRSASLGVQRYAHCWSGDVESNWHTLAQQIHGALNFSLCGLPYWNSDIGGFYTWRNYPDGAKDENFKNIYLRWMQFAAFTGLMRSHGTNAPREIFRFGNRGDFHFDAQLKAIRMRYSLIPYIYSTMHEIYEDDATLMRALMMDWPDDPAACACDDEFLFGRSILVAPMVTEGTQREVYLPEGSWIDFRTGDPVPAGTFTAEVPMDEVALYVRGGSIIPFGPDVNYTAEKDWDVLRIVVCPGADGCFTLYEDEGDGYGYENGVCSKIRFTWDDKSGTIEIGEREGSFPGMPEHRKFIIVPIKAEDRQINDSHRSGFSVDYDGKTVKKTLIF